jgi:hypothetical protein
MDISIHTHTPPCNTYCLRRGRQGIEAKETYYRGKRDLLERSFLLAPRAARGTTSSLVCICICVCIYIYVHTHTHTCDRENPIYTHTSHVDREKERERETRLSLVGLFCLYSRSLLMKERERDSTLSSRSLLPL